MFESTVWTFDKKYQKIGFRLLMGWLVLTIILFIVYAITNLIYIFLAFIISLFMSIPVLVITNKYSKKYYSSNVSEKRKFIVKDNQLYILIKDKEKIVLNIGKYKQENEEIFYLNDFFMIDTGYTQYVPKKLPKWTLQYWVHGNDVEIFEENLKKYNIKYKDEGDNVVIDE